ncbi:MAG TPA: DUF4214 domain-containing protein [Pirellulales bacterium]|nr:DUF4214 domain-containing protein [Pirellulales bacterium]
MAPNQKSGDDTQRLGFVVNGSVSTPSDADVYTFKAQPGTQVWMSLGNTSPGLDSVLELVDANGTVLARSDNALAESENPSLLSSSASGAAGFAGNLAAPLNSSTLLQGNFDPTNPSLNDTVYDPASQSNPGLRNLGSTNPLDAGFRVVLPGNPNSATPQDYYVRVRSRGPDLTNLHGGQSSGAYQLQVRLQEQEEFPGSTVQYADIRFAKNGIDVIGLPAHSPLLGESGQAGTAQNTDASTPPAQQPDPRPTAQDLGDPLTTDQGATSVAGNLATPTTVTWYKFELNYDFLNAVQGLNAGQKTWSTLFDVDYADGLSRPNTSISVFDSSGKLIYLGRDSNVADDQPTPSSANGLTDLTHGSAGQLDPYIGSVQLPAGADSFVDISATATGATIAGNTITVNFDGTTITFEFTAGALPAGDTNTAITVAAGDTPLTLASEAAQAIDKAFNNPNLVSLNGTRLTFANGAVADTSGALVTTSNTYYVAISSDATLPQAVDASFNAGSTNTLVRLEPVDSVNRIVEDHIGSQGGETAQPPGTLTPMFNGTVDTSNFNPAQPTPAQLQQVQSLNAGAVPFSLGNVVLFVDQKEINNVPGHLETVNPFSGGLVTDIGPTPGGVAGSQGYGDIAMRNDGRLYGMTLGPNSNTAGSYDLIDTGTGVSASQGVNMIVVPGALGLEMNALAFVQNGLNRQLFAVGSFPGNAGNPPYRNGFFQLNPDNGNSLNNPQSAPVLLNPAGVSANETITGMADIGGTLYAVTDAGGLYIINNPAGQASILFVAPVKDSNGNPIQFTALTAGPPDVSGGAYANDLFATDAQGKLYALNTSGALLPVFAGGATSVSLGTTNVIGLAFSTLDYNLWHVTDQRGNDPGHGINAAPDNSRNTGSANQPQAGNLSFYFGLESPDQTVSPGVIDVPGTTTPGGTTPQTLQPGSGNYVTDVDTKNVNQVYNTYNMPGGALGSLETNSFSLANYSYGDKPTLYFNYFLATQNASSTTQNPGTMLDSARVFVSADNGKTWQMLATNDASRQQANVSQVDGELPSFASASSSAYPNGVVPQRIQQLYDTAGGTWRQARIDLGDFAGQSNLKLRFDFTSAGSMNQGLPGDSFGNFNSPKRGQDNLHEGFYVDDITVGLAERGEMVTGDSANMTFVPTPQNLNSNGPTQILNGPYQLDIRRGTEYGVNVNPNLSDISLVHSFDTNDRLVDGFSILAPAGSALSDGQSFQVSDGTHVVTFEFDQGDTLTVAGNVVNNDSFTINDGTSSKQFVFVVNGNPLNPPPKQPNQVQVFVKSTDTPSVVASDIANAVNGSGLAVRAVTNVDPAYTGSLNAGQVRILATGAAIPQIDVSGAPELQSTAALHGGTPIAYAPGFTAAQVADAITNAINANTTLVGVRAGDVRNLINGVLTATGSRVDLFGAANLVALNAQSGQLTVSATSHTLTETGLTATTQVTISRGSLPGTNLASPVSVQVQALDLIRYDQNATGGFNLGTGEPSNNVQLINPATNQALQPGSPLTVLIPAGQSSVTFTVQAVEQTVPGGTELADGPVKVQLVATALGYSTGAETLDVVDDAQVIPTLTLALADPASGTILENAGPGAAHATVTRNSPDGVPLTVTLTSLDPGSARVPATVTIPAGSFSATFPIDAVDDNILRQQAVNVTIVASAVNFNSGTTTIAVQDDGDQNQIPLNAPAWQSQGPAPITFGQDENVTSPGSSAFNAVAGAIETVLVNPTNPNILYVGAVNGGVWETTNATSPSGPTWTPLTDTMPSLSIGALQFDTTDVSYQHLIAGIGRFSSFANAGGQLSGLIVSSNGGQTWSSITPSATSPATPVGQNISGVAERGSIILAAGNYFFNLTGGLFRSTDGGATFTLVSGSNGLPAGAISDLVGDPLDTKRFYAAVLTKGIFTSDDNGATWTDVTPAGLKSILNAAPQGDNIRIANSGTSVYFGYEKFDPNIGGSQLAAIYYSPAAGLSSTTWKAMDLPTTNENGTIVGLNPNIGGDDVPGAQGEIHFSIVADPNNPNLVYVGGDRQPSPFPNSIGATNFSGRLFRGDSSKPLGSQWTPITDNGTANGSAPHADSRHMIFDATGRLIETDDGGIFTLSNPETTQGIWTSLIGNLTVSEIHSVAYDTNTNTLIAGDQDTGTPEQQATGSPTWSDVSQGDGGDVTIDDSNPNQSIRYTSFAGFGAFLASTYDVNNNLISVSAPALNVVGTNTNIYGFDVGLPFVTTVKLNSLPGFSNHLVIGGGSAVYESFDGGQTLKALTDAGGNQAGGVGPNSLFGAAMSYGGTAGGIADPSVLWVGNNTLLLLRSGGFANPLTRTLYPGANVRALAVNPNNWRNAIVVDSANHVWLTADGGASFTDISGNLTNSVGGAAPLTADLFSVAFVPGTATNLIYVGSRDGVYTMKTSQQGVWSRYGAFMPDVPVYSLQYVASQQLLVAGTMGRGAWTASAISAAGDIAAAVNTQNVSDDGGVITGTVTRSGTFGNLSVTLASSDPARVPNTVVTIPDGLTTQTFSINVNDLLDANGNEVAVPRETVILTPLAGGLNPIGTFVNLTEDNPAGPSTSDDVPALTVTLSAKEMNPNVGVNSITGTVSRNTPTDQPLTVTLAASDPSRASTLQNGSATVVIPAGAQSVNFTLSYVDQFANDGKPHWVTVTATGITYQGLAISSPNGDGNDNEDPELNDPTGVSLDGDESYTIKIDAAQHVLSYDRRGDANINRNQGQVIIADSRISNSLKYGVVIEPGPRGANGSLPYPGVPINLSTINTDRVAPGATIENNLLIGNGAGGVQFLGDPNSAAGPLAAVPFGRIVNNTVYGGAQQTGVGVQVGQNASPTILNNIFANLATGVSVDNTSSSTHLEGSIYQNDGATLTGNVFNGGDLFSSTLSATDPLFVNAANNDFYLAPGSKAIDSAINSLTDRPDMISAKSLTGIPASPIFAPSRDLFGQLRVADPETNPSGIGSTLFKDRGAIERVDFVGPTAALSNPIDNSSLDQDPTLNVVHEVGVTLNNFAVQLNDGNGVGIDDSTVNGAKFAVYRDGVRLNQGSDYFFSYDTNTKTAYFTPATGTWATGHKYTIYVNNGTHFDPNSSAAVAAQSGIKDLAGNALQANRGTGSLNAGFTEFDVLLQSTGGDAPAIGVPPVQTTPENTALVFSSNSAAANPITIFNIDAPADQLTVTMATSQGTLSLADVAGITATGSGTSSLTLTGTAAAINAALNGTAAKQGTDGLTFTPNQYFFGTASIQISATDPTTGLTGAAVATIAVTEVNQAPVITTPSVQTIAENPPTALVFSNATGNAIKITDPNGGNGPDQVTITVPNGTVTLHGTAGLTLISGGSSGPSLTFSGLLSDINAALDGLKYLPTVNFTGATAIKLSANLLPNGTNPIGTGSAPINVVHVNQPPSVVTPLPNLSASEVTQATVIETIDLSKYIVDPDVGGTPPEAPPTYLVSGNNNPALVSATINGTILTVTLNAYQFGGATVSIEAIDSNPTGVQPVTTSFQVSVTEVNYPAITTPSEYEYVPGQPLVIAAPGVLSGDVDPNGHPLSAVLSQVPAHGKLMLNTDGPGSFTYIPDAGFNGRDSFIYQAQYTVTLPDGSTQSIRSPATVYLDSPTSRWVARMYSEVLGRTTQPADTEVNYWVGQLNGGVSRTQVASLFVTSPERRSQVIGDLYETYLDRPVDAAGLSYWLGVWNASRGPEMVQAGIIGSAEFYATAGGTPQAWVTALYQNLFERAPDAAGLAYWANVIQTSQSRSSVVLGFVTSDEYRLNLLRGIPNDPDDPDGPSDPNEPNDSGWYMQYLHRPIDQSGAMYWLAQMKAGYPQEAILEGILASDEYLNRA